MTTWVFWVILNNLRLVITDCFHDVRVLYSSLKRPRFKMRAMFMQIIPEGETQAVQHGALPVS